MILDHLRLTFSSLFGDQWLFHGPNMQERFRQEAIEAMKKSTCVFACYRDIVEEKFRFKWWVRGTSAGITQFVPLDSDSILYIPRDHYEKAFPKATATNSKVKFGILSCVSTASL